MKPLQWNNKTLDKKDAYKITSVARYTVVIESKNKCKNTYEP
jgi:hypothetical protein